MALGELCVCAKTLPLGKFFVLLFFKKVAKAACRVWFYDLILICGSLDWFVLFCTDRKARKEPPRGTLPIGFPYGYPSAKRRKGVSPFGIPGEAVIHTLCEV